MGNRGLHHSTLGAQPDDRLFDPDATLIEDYFAAYVEPHRRFATAVSFPRFVIHTATHLPEDTKAGSAAFAEWLQVVLKGWNRRLPTQPDSPEYARRQSAREEPFEPDFFARFSRYNSGEISEVTFFEALPPMPAGEHRDMAHSQIVLRVEIHGGYFTLTLFCPLLGQDAQFLAVDNNRPFCPRPDAEPNFLLHQPYERLAAALSGEELGVTSRAIGALFDSLAMWGKETFGNFRGLVLPETAIERAEPPYLVDLFADTLSPQDGPRLRETTLFLLRQRDALARSVFAASFTDVVGCYMLGGQGVYLSSVGAQAIPGKAKPELQELRFLLIFKDYPPDAEGLDLSRLQRWMLSRWLNRMLAIGTNRLLALRDLAVIKSWDFFLRETEANILNYRKQSDIEDVFGRLQAFASHSGREGSNLYSRCRQAESAIQNVKRMAEDLGVHAIPGWQSYDQFFRRRLEDTYEKITSLPDLYDKVISLVRVRQEQIEARTSLKLQLAANTLAAIGLISITDDPLTRPILGPILAELAPVQMIAAWPLVAKLLSAHAEHAENMGGAVASPAELTGYLLASLLVGASWLAFIQLLTLWRRGRA
ncbi:MAG: hypothetical protein K2P95_05230 [Hyphomonadaceae bacterium]|nr:hypothetical protein [Hyphomonadaceae bacterium]